MAFQLRAASKKRTKLRLAISGVPGGGKTFTSLAVAKYLIGEPFKLDDPSKSRVALIDTERSSSEFYADEFDFQHGNLPPELWHPTRFLEALRICEANADVVILDSITHEWKWCLAQVDILKPKFKGNTWSAWSEIRPPHDAFIDAIMSSSAHVICTMRSKMATEMVNDGGRKEVKQLGLETIQDAELDYAFHVVADMDRDTNSATVRKSRIRVGGQNPLLGKVFPHPGEAFTKLIVDCINTGEVVEAPKPKVPEQRREEPRREAPPMPPAETAAAAQAVADAAATAAVADEAIRVALASAPDAAGVDEIMRTQIQPLKLEKNDPRRAALIAAVREAQQRTGAAA